jgi:UPF0176 protein
MSYSVAVFYQFVALPDYAALREPLREFCASLYLKGTILLAPEGINGTIAGTPGAINEFTDALQSGSVITPAFDKLELKFSGAELQPFQRLKIRLKKEIVALGNPAADPTKAVGTYINPTEWNALLADPEILLIDTRNSFEVAAGTFARAINPQTTRFRDFCSFAEQNLDPVKHKKIAMFCTGGIRCEKASAYLLAQGFPEIYHLKGGILNYLETVPSTESQWQGKCFVFDERIALSHESFSPDKEERGFAP